MQAIEIEATDILGYRPMVQWRVRTGQVTRFAYIDYTLLISVIAFRENQVQINNNRTGTSWLTPEQVYETCQRIEQKRRYT